MTIAWESAGGSDVGRLRKGNEDTLRMDPERGIFLVADGMGGHAAGEVASELAATTAEGVLGDALDVFFRGALDGVPTRPSCSTAARTRIRGGWGPPSRCA